MDTGVGETEKKTAHTQVHDSQMFQEPWSNEVELPYQELGLTNQNQLFWIHHYQIEEHCWT